NNYRTIFWLSMIPGIIAVLLIVFFIKEKKEPTTLCLEKPTLTIKHFDWRFKFFVLIAAVFALGNSSDVFLILRAQQTGVSVVMIPIVYLVFNLVYSLSSIPAGIASDKFGRKRVILSGFVLFAVLYYGFAVVSDTKDIWGLFAFYGLFMGLTEGTQKAFLATIIPPDFKATAFGVYNTVVGLAMLPASLFGGWLWDHISPSATFYFGAVTSVLAALMFMVFILAVKKNT
ncbi:MAG TPA: MFS transporter, partial [Nitrospirae bacterium]|nr:MFS transporter [Nitrospirota bacterium]